MHTVLDLDLDFFVWPPYTGQVSRKRLPKTEYSHVASPAYVRAFFEERCGLSGSTPLLGSEAEEHVQAIAIWRRWIRSGLLSTPFTVIHVDAHSDLGSGLNRSALFFQTEVLALSLPDRSDLTIGTDYLNSGNYLVAAIANRWVHHLSYVYPTDLHPQTTASTDPGLTAEEIRELLQRNDETSKQLSDCLNMSTAEILQLVEEEGESKDLHLPVRDLPSWLFADCEDWRSGAIKLQHFTREGIVKNNRTPVHVEPPVGFQLISDNDFRFEGFTHMFLARSPQYCPVEADDLLPAIREYFTPG